MTLSPANGRVSPHLPVQAGVRPLGRQPKLLDRLREALRVRHYSPRTEESYGHWAKRYVFFHRVRHHAEMAEPEINAFLTHSAVKEEFGAPTQNQAFRALLFLHRHVLGRPIGELGDVVRARRLSAIPQLGSLCFSHVNLKGNENETVWRRISWHVLAGSWWLR